ncbi:MAG TPA: hypothetical protein VMS22_04645 [Candidatus Eisenbacteria bacterium]|jgi:hypothetical protein|nr:hypothetical protein [Candidatus Eisenbacteria bacterium]
MATIVRWNGADLPEELRRLPAGRYVVESVDDIPPLTPEEDAGIELALTTLEHGGGVDDPDVQRRIIAPLRR